jgi:SpoVK/Ycf46/Vps4 family AAA+-type ATPase
LQKTVRKKFFKKYCFLEGSLVHYSKKGSFSSKTKPSLWDSFEYASSISSSSKGTTGPELSYMNSLVSRTKKSLAFNFFKNNFENTHQKNSLVSEFFPQRKKFMQYWIFPLVGFVSLTWNSKTNFPILNKFIFPETSQQVNKHRSVSFYFKNTNTFKPETQNSTQLFPGLLCVAEPYEKAEDWARVQKTLHRVAPESGKETSKKTPGSHKILEIQKLNNFYLTFLQKKVFWNSKTEAFSNQSNNILWLNSQNFHQVFDLNFLDWGSRYNKSGFGFTQPKRSLWSYPVSSPPQISGQANFTNSLNQQNFQSSQIFENCPKKILPTFMKTDFQTINLSIPQKNLELKTVNGFQLAGKENFEIQKLQPVYFYYKAKLLLETNFKNSIFNSLRTLSNKLNSETKDRFNVLVGRAQDQKHEAEKSKNKKLLKKLKNQEKFFFKNVKGSKILNNFSSNFFEITGPGNKESISSPYYPRTKFYLSPNLSNSPQKFNKVGRFACSSLEEQRNLPETPFSTKKESDAEAQNLWLGGLWTEPTSTEPNLKFIAKKFHFDLNFFLFFKTKNSKLFQISKKQLTEKQKIHKIKKLEQLILTPTLDKFSEVNIKSKNYPTNFRKKFLFYLLKMTNFSRKINQLNKFLFTPSFRSPTKRTFNNSSSIPNEAKTKFKNLTYKLYLLNTISISNERVKSALSPKGPIYLGERVGSITNKSGIWVSKGSDRMESNFSLLLSNRVKGPFDPSTKRNQPNSAIVDSANFKNQTTKLNGFIRSGTFFKNQTFSSSSFVRGTNLSREISSGPVVPKELLGTTGPELSYMNSLVPRTNIFKTKTKIENAFGSPQQTQSRHQLYCSPGDSVVSRVADAQGSVYPTGKGWSLAPTLDHSSTVTKLNHPSVSSPEGYSLDWLSSAEDKVKNQFVFFLEKLLNEFLNLSTNMKSYLFVSPISVRASLLSQPLTKPKKKFLIPKILDKKNQSSVFKKEKIFRTLLSSKSVSKNERIPLSNKLKLDSQGKFGSSTPSVEPKQFKKFSKLSNQQKRNLFVKTLKQLKVMDSSQGTKAYVEEMKGEGIRNETFTQSTQFGRLKQIYQTKPFTPLAYSSTGGAILQGRNKSNSRKVQISKFSLNQTIQKVGFVFYGQKEVSGLYLENSNKELQKRDLDFFKNEKYFQKKRRRKKLKLENRRRKKRKRFYPRPVWLRYNLYRQFLNSRYDKSFQNKRTNFLMKFKRNSTVSASFTFSPQELSSNQATEFRYVDKKGSRFKGMKYNFLSKKFSSLKSIYRTNKQKWGNFLLDTNFLEKNLIKKFVLANHLPIYLNKNNSQITNQILNDFMPLYWKSYWLRSNLTPYMDRIKKNLNFQKSLAFQQESTEFSYNQTFLANLLGFFSPMDPKGACSGEAGFGILPSPIGKRGTIDLKKNMSVGSSYCYCNSYYPDLLFPWNNWSSSALLKTELSSSPISFYSNKKPSFEKFSDFSVSNSELIEKMRLIREHDRILFERISEIVKNVKYNMNLDGENSIKSYKLPKGKYNGLINAVSQNGQRNSRTETNSLANTLKSSMFQQLDPNFSLFSAFNGASISNTGTLFKPYGSNATLRVLWAFNKTNLFSFKEKNSIKNLWETYKNREQSKSNQTKKFFKKTFTNISKNGWSTSKFWPDSGNQQRMLNLVKKEIPDFFEQPILKTKDLKKKNYLNKFTLEKMLRSAETHQRKLYYSSNVSNKKFFYVDFKDSFINKGSFSPNFINPRNRTYFKRVVMEGSSGFGGISRSGTQSNNSENSFINERKADSFQKPLLKKSSVFFWWSNKNFLDWSSGGPAANFTPPENSFFINSKTENSFFLKFIWSFSILFHLCILINFLKLPELRNLLKFQLSLIYKISNIYFIPLFYFYNSVQLAGKKFFFCLPFPHRGRALGPSKAQSYTPEHIRNQTKATNKIKTISFNLYTKNFYSKQIQKLTKKQYFNKLNKSILQFSRINQGFGLWAKSPSSSERGYVDPAIDPLRTMGLGKAQPTDSNKFVFFVFNNVKIYNFIFLSDKLALNWNLSKGTNTVITPSSLWNKEWSLGRRSTSWSYAPGEQSSRAPNFGMTWSMPSTALPISRVPPIQGYEHRKMLGTKLSLLVSKMSKIFVILGLNSVQFIYQILLQGISFVESILVLIYKFLEKPAELMVESIAQIFLIEWISDISTFLPETLDKNLWQSFQKLSRPTRIMGLFLGGPSVNYLLPFISRKEQLSFEHNSGLLPSFTSFPFSFLFLNTFKFYSMEIWQFLLKPDMDIYSRQKRGIYFMNIWGEIFVQAAEKYQMNATSLATNNLEQEKFLERLLKDPEIFSIKNNNMLLSNEGAKSNPLPTMSNSGFFNNTILSSTKERTKENHKFSEKEQLFVRLKKAIRSDSGKGENSFASFPVNQHIIASCFGALAYATTERDLFLDISPPKSFRSSRHNSAVQGTTAAYLHSPVSFILGPLVCEVYSGLFSKKVSKNILLIPSLNETNTSSTFRKTTNSGFDSSLALQKKASNSTNLGNALIQALAGETEMKLIIDNAKRYAANFHNKAIGIRLLKDVFMSIALQTPSFFLMEDIHFIGEKRPMLLGNFADENSGSETINFEQDEVYFQNLFNSRQKTLTYKRFSNTDSSSIPSNFFTKHFFAYKNNKVYKSFGSNLSKEFSNSNQFQNIRTNSKKQKRHPMPLIYSLQLSKPLEQNFGSGGGNSVVPGTKQTAENLLKNSLVSRLQKQSEEFFAPPSTSPFTILLMKDQNKLKGTKSNFIPWTIFKNQKNNVTGDAQSSKSASNKTIRSKIAELADITLRNFSVSIDMITDLLVIVDSVRSNRGFVVFATTPIPSVLDPALRRPGRFDETLCLPEFSIMYGSGSGSGIKNPESQIFKISKKSISQYTFQTRFYFQNSVTLDSPSFNKNQTNLNQRVAATLYGTLDFSKGNLPTVSLLPNYGPGIKVFDSSSSYKVTTVPRTKKLKKLHETAVKKKLTKIFFLTSSLVSDFLIQTDLLKNQTTKYFNQTFQYHKNSDQLTVLFLLFSSTSQYKDLIPLFLAPKVVDFFYSLGLSRNTSPEFKKLSSLSFLSSSLPLGGAGLSKVLERSSNQRIFYNLTDSSTSTDFIFSILQKRYLFQKNFIVSKLLMENTSYSLKEPPGPPVSEILMPAKKYEAFKATEKDFIFKNSFSIYEKMHTHQKQRFLKKLYNQPVQIYFKSLPLNGTKFNDFTTFVNSFKELGSIYSKSSGSSANSTQILRNISSTNYYYKTRFLMRHRFSITNQWSNAQLPEHNAESTFLSDVDWRSMYVESLQETNLLNTNKKVHTQKDYKIDFTDADQYYNPRIRKWILRSSIHSVGLAQTSQFMEPNQSSSSENIFTYEIYYHFLMQAFYKTYNYFDKNRELLDYFIFKYLLKGSLLELNSIFMLTRFYKK